MVRHTVTWRFKDDVLMQDRPEAARRVKEAFEALPGTIEGIGKLTVEIEPLPLSNTDIMLYSEFDTLEALENYRNHPAHKEVAKKYVHPVLCNRCCFDFEVK